MAQKLSVLERIARDIETTLKTVSPAGNYTNTFTVRRRGVRGNAPTATQIQAGQVFAVVSQPSPVKLEDASFDQTGWLQPFWIDLFVCPDEANEEALDSRLNSARADCEKALTYVENSRTRGGLAHDTRVDSPVVIQEPSGLLTVQVRVIVQYYTVKDDPYSSINSNVEN